ncbi:MAG: hypothetical protein IJM30_06160 [Thermoguttaceae bacterium]|nr:hypothetical protein [Thermoguttaceae bacterium]
MQKEPLIRICAKMTVESTLALVAFALTLAFLGLGLPRSVCADELSGEPIIVSVSTNSENEGYEAYKAFDGDKSSFWHSQFSRPPFEYSPIPISCGYQCGCVDEHPRRKVSRDFDPNRPFELRIDLRGERLITGFRYFPRADGTPNGQIGEYELYIFQKLSDSDASAFVENGEWEGELGEPIVAGAFTGSEKELEEGTTVLFERPVAARYAIFRAKTELANRPFAAVAELEFLSDGAFFRPIEASSVGLCDIVPKERAVRLLAELVGVSEDDIVRSPYFDDLLHQYGRLAIELGRADYYRAISRQLPSEQAGILPTDRDPLDVVLRRTRALWLLINELDDDFFDGSANNDLDPSLNEDVRLWRELNEASKIVSVENPETRFQLFALVALWRRSLIFKRAELDFAKILFVKRNRSNYNHICDQFYGRSAMPGGGLFTLSKPFGEFPSASISPALRSALAAIVDSRSRVSLEFGDLWRVSYCPADFDLLAESKVVGGRLDGKKLENGAFISPELSFDGKRIAFAFCECQGSPEHLQTLDLTRGHTQEGRCYHVFTCDVDGGDLRMITDGTWNDFDPCYLPNGRLAFISERRNGYLRCGRDCPTYTLFDMNQDGSKIRCLSRHETNEWAPSVSNSGQILWTRWDYIDRFGCIAHGVWTTSPDGRNPRAVCGNYAPRHLRPDSVLDVRAIPGSSKLIATAGPHHGQSFGSIVEIDPNAPDDPISPITRMTPEIGFPESQDGSQVWGTPWPLAEDLFMAVADYSFDPRFGREGGAYQRGDYGIYLVDALGNRELLYRDPDIGASTPIPLVSREAPPVAPSLVPESEIVDEPFVTPPAFDAERPQGVVSIQNVYATDVPFPEGTKIKEIRVVQIFCMSVPSGYPPYEIGVREATSTDSVKLTRRVWGTAPVEEDGSAYFYVPADCELYFQALDEDGLVVQSMRSGTALRPNENLSCIGCHEPREATGAETTNSPGVSGGDQVPLALRREPSRLKSEGSGTQPVNFPELVQPVLDKHCVECHRRDDSREKGAPNLDREPYERGFYASYWNLLASGRVFNDYVDSLRTTPGQFGARASSLYDLIQDHYDVKLSDDERRRIALWLDTNSLFFGVYEKDGCERELRGERAVPTLE